MQKQQMIKNEPEIEVEHEVRPTLLDVFESKNQATNRVISSLKQSLKKK